MVPDLIGNSMVTSYTNSYVCPSIYSFFKSKPLSNAIGTIVA